MASGILYIIATPIGNLEDITLRALRILKEVDFIAAEDTRHTKKLLSHYGIRKPLTSYHEHNERAKSNELIRRLQNGSAVALVSDAGTPLLSDPGFRLVKQAVESSIPVVPVPGPSALTALLSASGLPTDSFVFEGFLPNKKTARRERLTQLRDENRTIVLYESPHRMQETLQDIFEILGDRELVLGRELTKVHEEILRGPASQFILESGRREWRGEVSLVVGAAKKVKDRINNIETELKYEIQKLRDEGMRVKEIAEILGEKYSLSKREIYNLALPKKGSDLDI